MSLTPKIKELVELRSIPQYGELLTPTIKTMTYKLNVITAIGRAIYQLDNIVLKIEFLVECLWCNKSKTTAGIIMVKLSLLNAERERETTKITLASSWFIFLEVITFNATASKNNAIASFGPSRHHTAIWWPKGWFIIFQFF